ncbi:nucleoid occlusion factor SlmA [Alginatibacterium sediminis]|uniref:Nucleoid occlusion factor SlmA n=1 Tax=Alginatibacterium sediminis TaxID=2164068 RepID=A0A420EN30_9ALTE|nr:nucleoid occlusion factor SlmA [Alginatibacterium sediminis]RKF22135.1 nucleoid occlusion factor SlmA [Alginatibacterium sediminis]
MTTKNRVNRREQILQALAHMLENQHGQRITTARLAAQVGVSEAALYRHFPSKARMFEGLIEFMEETILTRINRIFEEEKDTVERSLQIVRLVIGFAELNPGLSRILTGDVLLGENERLRQRTSQLMDKIELQLKQVLRERKLREGKSFAFDEAVLANYIMAYLEGRIAQYVRSDYQRKPSQNLDQHLSFIRSQLMSV